MWGFALLNVSRSVLLLLAVLVALPLFMVPEVHAYGVEWVQIQANYPNQRDVTVGAIIDWGNGQNQWVMLEIGLYVGNDRFGSYSVQRTFQVSGRTQIAGTVHTFTLPWYWRGEFTAYGYIDIDVHCSDGGYTWKAAVRSDSIRFSL